MSTQMTHAKPRSREGIGSAPTRSIEDIARVIVDCAFHIHEDLGPGMLESVYETILTGALARAGLIVERQRPVVLRYDGMEFPDAFRLDLLVDSTVIVEIKSVETLTKAHAKQLLTYLRLTKQPLGLLINFGSASFKDGIKRIVNNHTDFAASRLRVNQNSVEQAL
jgi:GxxExxY protein